jgi:hypothetical protein
MLINAGCVTSRQYHLTVEILEVRVESVLNMLVSILTQISVPKINWTDRIKLRISPLPLSPYTKTFWQWLKIKKNTILCYHSNILSTDNSLHIMLQYVDGCMCICLYIQAIFSRHLYEFNHKVITVSCTLNSCCDHFDYHEVISKSNNRVSSWIIGHATHVTWRCRWKCCFFNCLTYFTEYCENYLVINK